MPAFASHMVLVTTFSLGLCRATQTVDSPEMSGQGRLSFPLISLRRAGGQVWARATVG